MEYTFVTCTSDKDSCLIHGNACTSSVVDRNNVIQRPILWEPVFPDLYSFVKRLDTYETASELLKTDAFALAKAGLYFTGIGDVTCCFFCGKSVFSWSKWKIPIEEHEKGNPGCLFLAMIGR